MNQFVSDYVKQNPKRLLSCGSLHPRHSTNILSDVEQLVRMGIRMIKIHPPHQLLFPNDYLRGVTELEIIYRAAEANGIPVMFHTGTSIFPGAATSMATRCIWMMLRSTFPKMKILLAHGGRPLWMDTAFFLVRRHPNVYLDISGIPPKTLLNISRVSRDRREDVLRDGLAGSGRSGHSEKPGGFSWPGIAQSCAGPDFEQDRAGDLARIAARHKGTSGRPIRLPILPFALLQNYFAGLFAVSSSTRPLAP